MKKLTKATKLVVSLETVRLLGVRGGSNGDPPPTSARTSDPYCRTDFCSYQCGGTGGSGGSIGTCFAAGCETYQSQ